MEWYWPEEGLICLNLQLRFKDCNVSFESISFFFFLIFSVTEPRIRNSSDMLSFCFLLGPQGF